MDLSNVKLVTHRGCMDGSTCAIVFLAAGGNRKNIHFSSPSHDEADSIVSELTESWNGLILVADVSISLSLAKKLDAHHASVLVLDHHKSAIPLSKFSWCEIDVENKRAGGRMLYEFFICQPDVEESRLKPLHDLVHAADDYDRWIREIPESEDLAILHNVIKQDNFIDRFVKNPSIDFLDQEKYIIKFEKEQRDEYIKRKKSECVVVRKNIMGQSIKVGMVEAGNHQSELGNAICEDFNLNVDIAVLISARSVSLRASRDCPVDLSVVASNNGGGGHAKAAGVGVNKLLGESFVEMVFSKLIW